MPLLFDALKDVDLKLALQIDEVTTQGLSFTKVTTDVALTDDKLTFDPLSFNLANATVSGTAGASAGGPTFAIALKADDLDVGALLDTLDATTMLTGTANVILDVSGTGVSLAGIAGTLDGKASVSMENGKLDVRELDLLVGGVTTILGSLFSKDVDMANLNRLALAWDIKTGVASQKVLLLDTQYSTVTGSGEIYLGKETLDLKIVPHSKGITLNLSVPVRVGGTLLNPTFTPDECALALRIGDLLGATLFPPTMLLALGDMGSSNGDCSKANQPSEGSTVGDAVDGVVKNVGDTIDSLFGGYVLVVPFLVTVTDHRDARDIVMIGFGLSFLGLAGMAPAGDGFWPALFWRSLAGAGPAGTYMPGLKVLTDRLDAKRHARAAAFYTASFSVGASTSYLASGLLFQFLT